MAVLDFQAYLNSFVSTPVTEDWGDGRYTATTAELPLQVQTIVGKPQSDDQQRRGERLFAPSEESVAKSEDKKAQPKREQFAVLEGLRKLALAEKQHVLLVGRPGSGKSTALRRLLWEEAQGCWESLHLPSPQPLSQYWERGSKIPVLLELRDFRDGDLLEWIRQKLARKRWRLNADELTDLLLDGRLLLLFDGVNELASAEAWRELDSFRRDFVETPMIFSTRELGAGTDLGIEKKLEMLPLTEPQMQEFIHKRLPGQAEQLLRQMQGRLRELAETPLLLKMLCDVVAAQPDGKIPKSRGELFRQFAQDYDRIKHRGVLPVSEGFLQFRDELLQRLAVAMMEGGEKPTEFILQIDRVKAEQLFEQLLIGRVNAPAEKAKEWLGDLIEHHLLQLAANPKQIEFNHQLFQEYYAAEWLLTQWPSLLRDSVGQERIQQEYLNYLKWTEVITLVLALEEDEILAVQTVKLALETDLVFGAKLTGMAKVRYQFKMISLLTDRILPSQLEISLLSISQSEAAIPILLKALEHQSNIVRKSAVEALEKLNSDQAILGLIKALQDKDYSVMQTALNALRKIKAPALLKVNKQAIPALIEAFVIFLENSKVQSKKKLYDCYSQSDSMPNMSKQTITVLIKALEDPNHFVRSRAVEKLGHFNSKEMIPALLNALEDQNYFVRTGTEEALPMIAEPQPLATLWQIQLQAEHTDILPIILAIQQHCGFYNYEVWQAAQKRRKTEKTSDQNQEGKSSVTVNVDSLGILQTGTVNVKGNQVGIQATSGLTQSQDDDPSFQR